MLYGQHTCIHYSLSMSVCPGRLSYQKECSLTRELAMGSFRYSGLLSKVPGIKLNAGISCFTSEPSPADVLILAAALG
jgi:hypothetical protein